MMSVKKRVVHTCVASVMAMFGCGRAPEPVAQQAALGAEATAPEVTPSASRTIARAIDDFAVARAAVEDPDARWSLRLRHYEDAQGALRRVSVDDAELMGALGQLRQEFMGTAETQVDYEAHETARIRRGERIELTNEDRENSRRLAESGEIDRLLNARRTEVRTARADDISRAETARVNDIPRAGSTPPSASVDLPRILRGEYPEAEANHAGVQLDEARHAY